MPSPLLRLSSALALALAVVAGGCAGNTKVTRTWAEPSLKEKRFKSAMVLVVANEEKRRVTAEDRIAAQMTKAGLAKALRSHDVLPTVEGTSREQLEQAVKDSGVEALLVVRVVGVGQQTQVHEGREQWVPVETGFDDYYGYVTTSYGLYRSPEVNTVRVITAETTLWDVATRRVVWGGQSDSTTANETITTAELTDDYIKGVAKELRPYFEK